MQKQLVLKEKRQTKAFLPALLGAMVLCFAMAWGVLANAEYAYAADTLTADTPAFEFRESSFTFDKKTAEDIWGGTWGSYSFYLTNSSVAIVKAKSSNSKVASVVLYGKSSIMVYPKKAGKTTITCTDQYNRTAKIKITVKKNYFTTYLKLHSTTPYLSYGNKSLSLYSLPNTKVTLKVGNKKYSATTNSDGRALINLNKAYKTKSKITATYKNGKYSAKVKSEVRGSSYAQAWCSSVTSKNLYTRIYNAHAGDKLIVKAGGANYTFKIKTDNYQGYTNKVFKLKKPINECGTIKVTVKDKYGKVQETETYKVSDNALIYS